MSMEWATLLAPVVTESTGAITDAIPLGITVMVGLVGIGLVLRVLGKFGVKK